MPELPHDAEVRVRDRSSRIEKGPYPFFARRASGKRGTALFATRVDSTFTSVVLPEPSSKPRVRRRCRPGLRLMRSKPRSCQSAGQSIAMSSRIDARAVQSPRVDRSVGLDPTRSRVGAGILRAACARPVNARGKRRRPWFCDPCRLDLHLGCLATEAVAAQPTSRDAPARRPSPATGRGHAHLRQTDRGWAERGQCHEALGLTVICICAKGPSACALSVISRQTQPSRATPDAVRARKVGGVEV